MFSFNLNHAGSLFELAPCFSIIFFWFFFCLACFDFILAHSLQNLLPNTPRRQNLAISSLISLFWGFHAQFRLIFGNGEKSQRSARIFLSQHVYKKWLSEKNILCLFNIACRHQGGVFGCINTANNDTLYSRIILVK